MSSSFQLPKLSTPSFINDAWNASAPYRQAFVAKASAAWAAAPTKEAVIANVQTFVANTTQAEAAMMLTALAVLTIKAITSRVSPEGSVGMANRKVMDSTTGQVAHVALGVGFIALGAFTMTAAAGVTVAGGLNVVTGLTLFKSVYSHRKMVEAEKAKAQTDAEKEKKAATLFQKVFRKNRAHKQFASLSSKLKEAKKANVEAQEAKQKAEEARQAVVDTETARETLKASRGGKLPKKGENNAGGWATKIGAKKAEFDSATAEQSRTQEAFTRAQEAVEQALDSFKGRFDKTIKTPEPSATPAKPKKPPVAPKSSTLMARLEASMTNIAAPKPPLKRDKTGGKITPPPAAKLSGEDSGSGDES